MNLKFEFQFIFVSNVLTRTSFIKRKVYPKEGTRVRIPGMYHITTWYGAVGHWGEW